jgi:hypothetical protein
MSQFFLSDYGIDNRPPAPAPAPAPAGSPLLEHDDDSGKMEIEVIVSEKRIAVIHKDIIFRVMDGNKNNKSKVYYFDRETSKLIIPGFDKPANWSPNYFIIKEKKKILVS